MRRPVLTRGASRLAADGSAYDALIIDQSTITQFERRELASWRDGRQARDPDCMALRFKAVVGDGGGGRARARRRTADAFARRRASTCDRLRRRRRRVGDAFVERGTQFPIRSEFFGFSEGKSAGGSAGGSGEFSGDGDVSGEQPAYFDLLRRSSGHRDVRTDAPPWSSILLNAEGAGVLRDVAPTHGDDGAGCRARGAPSRRRCSGDFKSREVVGGAVARAEPHPHAVVVTEAEDERPEDERPEDTATAADRLHRGGAEDGGGGRSIGVPLDQLRRRCGGER